MNETTKIILKGVGALVVLGGLFFGARAIIKKVTKKKEEKAEDETITASMDISANTSSVESSDNYNPSADVKAIGDMIYGNNFFEYTDEVNAIIVPLSDARLRKLASAYKSKYGLSLYKNLTGECCYNVYTSSENRLKSLGLT